jgi:hypothetical protein
VLTFLLGDDLGWKKAPVVLTLPGDEDGDDELQLACNGKSFTELPVKAQKAFKKYIIPVIIIEKVGVLMDQDFVKPCCTTIVQWC